MKIYRLTISMSTRNISQYLCSRNYNINQIGHSHRKSILVRKLHYKGRAKVTLVLYLINCKGHRYLLFNIELGKVYMSNKSS